jgi:uncharacterized protein (DUF433 family)
MNKEITLVDRGRGLQLSTTRITVQDLVPYFQEGCSHEEIMRWIPSLTHEEISIVEQYYKQHKAELDEEDRRIREYTEERIREQKTRFPDPEETPEQLLARLKKLLRERQEKNGERNSGGHQHERPNR